MKKLFIILLVILFVLTGCVKKEDSENSKETTVVEIPKEATGYFYEKVAGRGILNISNAKKDGSVDIVVDWGSSAYETAHWEMSAVYNPKTQSFDYIKGKQAIRTYDASGKYKEEIVYEDGTGSFAFKDGAIIWHDDKAEKGSEDIIFLTEEDREKQEVVEIPNPWIETQDLNVAIKNAGVEFEAIAKDVLPKGSKFVTYISAVDILSALYETKDGEMMIRKSPTLEGKELAGDYNEYSKVWNEHLRGSEVYLEGDGELANLVYYVGEDGYYSISYNAGQEGKGLSVEEVEALMIAMEPKAILK